MANADREKQPLWATAAYALWRPWPAALVTAALLVILWLFLVPAAQDWAFLKPLLVGENPIREVGPYLIIAGSSLAVVAGIAWLAKGEILIPWGALWLLGVAAAFAGIALLFGSREGGGYWGVAAGLFLTAFGGGPIAFLFTDKRAKQSASQASNEAFAAAVTLLGHKEVAARQGGIHALDRMIESNSDEHHKIMDIMAAYLRAGTTTYVNATMVKFQRVINKNDADVSALHEIVPLYHRALDARAPHPEKQAALSQTHDRLVKIWESGEKGLQKLWDQTEITERLLPSLPMPVDLEAAVAVIRRRLSSTKGDVHGDPRTSGNGEGLDLSSTYLYNADLSKASLRRADLSDSHLMGCVLEGADLTGARLASTKLYDTDLTGATLVDVELSGGRLRDCVLDGVKLSGALLHGTDLRGADLRGVRDLTHEQVKVALGNAQTKLPEGIVRPGRWS